MPSGAVNKSYLHGGSQCFISLHIRDSRRFNLSKFLQPGCSSASVSKSSIGHGYFKNEICAAKLLHLAACATFSPASVTTHVLRKASTNMPRSLPDRQATPRL